MTTDRTDAGYDPRLDVAREEAEGIEVFADLTGGGVAAAHASEDAQGFQSFTNPDGLVPAIAARENDPGHEMLSADEAGLGDENDDHPRAAEDEER